MGSLVHAGVLKADGTLTEATKNSFIRDVKNAVIYGTGDSNFPCGEPVPPARPDLTFETFRLEDEKLYASFHKDILIGRLQATAKKMDLDPSFAFIPAFADPIALAGSFGIKLPPLSFPDGFIPYLTGQLVPKFFIDLLDAGIPDFILPANLVPELLKLLSVPTPPNLIPDVPIPPIPLLTELPSPPEAGVIPDLTLPSVELPTVPEIFQPPDIEIPPPLPPLPAGTLPVLPVNELQVIVDRELAIVKAIPELLMKLISEVPKLISKLLIPTEILPYICKIISESGAFPLGSPANAMEKAYNSVLSQWFAYFLYLNMIAKSIGSAEGSAVAGIAKIAPINLEPPEPEKPERNPNEFRPSEKVIAAANEFCGLGGSSYSSEQARYQQRMFYAEDFNSTFLPGTITVEGKLSDPVVTDTFNNNLDDYTKNGIDTNPFLYKNIGVNFPEGFRISANWAARTASSCGLFARYCYLRAGASNEFFLSMYPYGTAIDAILMIGSFRNYRWMDKQPDGTYTLNKELVDLAPTIGVPGAGGYTKESIIKAVGTWGYKVESGQLTSISTKLDKHLITDASKLAVLNESYLAHLAKTGGEFPVLDPGDVIIMYSTAGNRGETRLSGTEHVTVVAGSRPIKVEFRTISNDNTITPIIGIHGGQPDDKNIKGEGEASTAGFIPYESVVQKKTEDGKTFDFLNTAMAPVGTKLLRGKERLIVDSIGKQRDGSNFYVRPAGDQHFPTAVLPGSYDRGYVVKSGSGAGFYITRSTIRYASGNEQVATNKAGPYPGGPWKKVYAILKTDNYLDPVTNKKTDNADERAAAEVAMTTMDKHPIMQYFMSPLRANYFRRGLVYNCFRNINEGVPFALDGDAEDSDPADGF